MSELDFSLDTLAKTFPTRAGFARQELKAFRARMRQLEKVARMVVKECNEMGDPSCCANPIHEAARAALKRK